MTRILVLGGGGMLGHKLVQRLGAHHEVWATFRRFDARLEATGLFDRGRLLDQVDAWSPDSVARAVEAVRPAWAVNCIGLIKQLEEAKDPREAIYLNALWPHLLADSCVSQGVRMLHVSTDCVFSGRRGRYLESDLTDAEDLYGRTKALGEVNRPGCLTLRTSIVGRDLSANVSLIDWFLAHSGGRVRGYARAVYSGLTTEALSREVGHLIGMPSPLEGLYQVSSHPISKFDLLHLVNQAFDAGVAIDRDEEFVSDRSLVSDRFWQAVGREPPSWQAMVVEMARDPTAYDRFRTLSD
jgi:dTDP-4-dehydrorhamnose reductase